MPWYDYRCRECGHEYSLNRSIADRDAISTCPNCATTNTERRLSTFITIGGGGGGGQADPGCIGGG